MIELTPETRLEKDIEAIINDSTVKNPITRIEKMLADIAAGELVTITPVTRIEKYLAKISGIDVELPKPVTRVEYYLAGIAGEDVPVPSPITRLEYLLKEWYDNESELTTLTGAIVSFIAKAVKPIKSLVVDIEPVQSGSGDPSPDNVRPITGWTGCNISFYDKITTSKTITESFAYTQDGSGTASPTNIRAIHGPALSFARDNGTTLSLYKGILTVNADGTSTITEPWIYYLVDGETYKCNGVNAESGFYYLNISTPYISNATIALNCSHYPGQSYTHRTYNMYIVNSATSGTTRINDTTRTETTSEEYNDWLKSQVRAGTPVQVVVRQNTEYALSAPETKRALASLGGRYDCIPISWQTEAGTMHGGTLTINQDGSVDVTPTHVMFTFDGGFVASSGGSESKHIFSRSRPSSFPATTASYWEKGYKSNILSLTSRGTSSTNIADGSMYAGSSYLMIRLDSVPFSDEGISAFLAQNPLQILAPIFDASIVTYHLDSIEQLKTIVGTNNIWADAGNVTVTAQGITPIE